MYWEKMREEEFSVAIDKFGGLCALPLTGLEKHGQHLPVGTDGMIANAIIEEALKLEDTVIFPAGCWLGDTSTHYETTSCGKPKWRGAIELSTDLQLTLLEEICDEIRRCGFRKVLVIYKHPSCTDLAGLFTRHVEYVRRDYATMIVSAVNEEKAAPAYILKTVTERKADFPMITDEDIQTLNRWAASGQASVAYVDTALMLAAYSRLVAKERMNKETNAALYDTSAFEEDMIFTGMHSKKYPNGIYSQVADGCTESIGAAILKIQAEHLASVFKLLKEDEECVRIANGIPQ